MKDITAIILSIIVVLFTILYSMNVDRELSFQTNRASQALEELTEIKEERCRKLSYELSNRIGTRVFSTSAPEKNYLTCLNEKN